MGVEIARSHAKRASGRLSVVPIIVDDLARALPVLEAVCEVGEGRLFLASSAELKGPVQATGNIARREAIEAALTTVPLGKTRHVYLEENEDTLDPKFGDPPAGSEPSVGETAVLGVARAIAHSGLDDRSLAVVAYREHGIDYDFRRCLWDLGARQLPDMPHDNLRTLVFVAEGDIDIALHCGTGSGFRFALRGSRLLKRHGRDDLEASVRSIVRHDGPIVLFLGAGFSASSRMPLGNALRDSAIRHLFGIDEAELVSSERLARRFYQWISEHPDLMTANEAVLAEDDFVEQLTLEQVIREERRRFPNLPTLLQFREHHDEVIDEPGLAVHALSHVLSSLNGRVIVVEVNFDRLVEHHANHPVRVFSTDTEFRLAPDYLRRYLDGDEEAIPILKLHGSIENVDSCVVSEEQTQRGLGGPKLDSLRAIIDRGPCMWVYVGASMRDHDLEPVLAYDDFAEALDERWVGPFLDEGVERFAKKRLPRWEETELRTLDSRLITETADSFFQALRVAVSGYERGT